MYIENEKQTQLKDESSDYYGSQESEEDEEEMEEEIEQN